MTWRWLAVCLLVFVACTLTVWRYQGAGDAAWYALIMAPWIARFRGRP